MAYLSAVSSLDNVIQYEIDDPTQTTGGPGGGANAQAQALLNRTKYIYDNFFNRLTQTLDNVPEGTSYKRVQAALADAINNETRLPTALGTADANLIGALTKIANAKLFINAAGNGFDYSNGIKFLTATRDMATASGSQAITGTGFKPSALIIFAEIAPTAKASWGLSDASNRAALFIYGSNFNDSNNVVVYLKTDDSNYNYAALASMDSGGFTLNWTKVGSQTGTAYMKILTIR